VCEEVRFFVERTEVALHYVSAKQCEIGAGLGLGGLWRVPLGLLVWEIGVVGETLLAVELEGVLLVALLELAMAQALVPQGQLHLLGLIFLVRLRQHVGLSRREV
jgi:hypothetical protein